MSVTELHPPATPDPGMVALLVACGLSDPRCGSATWVEVEAAQKILEVGVLMSRLQMGAIEIMAAGLKLSGAETFGEYVLALDAGERARVEALQLMVDMRNPLGDMA